MRKSLHVFVLSILFFLLVLVNQSFAFNNINSPRENPTENPKCTDCHNSLIENKSKHTPAKESCESCHKVNFKEHTENGSKGLHLAEDIPALCFNCHNGLKNDLSTIKNIHQVIKNKNSCINCHNPHSSVEDKLLVLEEKKLCLSCHNKEIATNGKKTTNISRLLTNAKVIHPPVENGCIACHKPHASDNNYLLINSFPKDNYVISEKETFALCWECHDIELLNAVKTTTSTQFRNGEKNLHFVHIKKGKTRSCVMCHNVHASMNEHLIEGKIEFGEWSMPIRYIAKKNGGSCFPGCHAKKEYTY